MLFVLPLYIDTKIHNRTDAEVLLVTSMTKPDFRIKT